MTSPIAQALKDAQIDAIQRVISPTVTEAVDLTSPETVAAALVKTATAITNPAIVQAILKTQAQD